MHKTIEPAILYLGTPVALLTTENEDGSINVAPNSSIFWLGWSCMIGIDASSKTTENLQRTGRCVINMPSFDLADEVNALALYTGKQSVPLHKRLLGYEHKRNKLENTALTLVPAIDISGARIEQCPIQMETEVVQFYPFAKGDAKMGVSAMVFELRVVRVHAQEEILFSENENKIDPTKWNPLIMCFRRFFGLSAAESRSKLNTGSEDLYAPWKMAGVMGAITRTALAISSRDKTKTVNHARYNKDQAFR